MLQIQLLVTPPMYHVINRSLGKEEENIDLHIATAWLLKSGVRAGSCEKQERGPQFWAMSYTNEHNWNWGAWLTKHTATKQEQTNFLHFWPKQNRTLSHPTPNKTITMSLLK